MPGLKTRQRRGTQPARAKHELTLAEAMERIDPDLAISMSIFYAEMARAQREGDQEAVEYARQAIAEMMRGVPDGPIDISWEDAMRRRNRKLRRQKSRP